MLSHSSSFYSQSPYSIQSISLHNQTLFFHNCHPFQCFLLFSAIHKFQTNRLYNSCISKHCNVFTFAIPSHTSVAVAGQTLNDRLIPITTSYRVQVVVECGGFIRSSDNLSTSFPRRYIKYGGLP